MKLLYYSTSYHASHGGSVQAIEFYQNLDAAPHLKERFLFPDASPKTSIVKGKNSRLRSLLKKSSLLQILFFFRRNCFYLKPLEKFISENSPDVVILQIDSNFLQIRRLKIKFPSLLICTQVNGSPFDEPFKNIAFRPYFLKKQQQSYLAADLNFFISDFLRERIMGNKFDPERDKVVQNGTDISRFRPLGKKKELRLRLNYSADKKILGYVGTIDEHKRLELLVKVVQGLLSQHPELQLVIIGDGPGAERLKTFVRDLEIEGFVDIKGWIDHSQINDHLNCFDVAIHHHANDYMSPLKIFEYLAAGVPVIGPDIPSVREVFTEGEHLLLTLPSKENISENISEILNNPEKAEDRALRGRKYVEENFTWALYTEKLMHHIKQKWDRQ